MVKPAKQRDDAPTLVSARALAVHFCCTHQYIAKLASDGVIEKSGTRYDQDQCRARYLAHLRLENRKSPRIVADAEYAKQKAHWLALKIAQQERTTMPVSEHVEVIDEMAGVTLTELSGWPARVAGHDLALRRRAEAVLFELRTKIANVCNARADAEEQKQAALKA